MRTEKPAYLQLYEELREEILRGARARGDRLPSRRILAQERQVSAVTVDHCYELLCQEGYAEAQPRSGYYVIYRAEDGFAQPGADEPPTAAAERLRKPQSGWERPESEAFPFSVMARTMRRVLTEYGDAVMDRQPGQGNPELRAALSRYLARNRGMRLKPEQIVIGSGAEHLYGMVVEMLGQERIYAIESPGYERIEQVYRARGVACELLPLGRDGIRSQALKSCRASVLHITPYRSFPTGVTASASKRQEYLRWAAEPDRYIVEDDFESEFSLLRKPEETIFIRAERENVIYLNTFSRTISPALRAGYMVLPESLLPLMREKTGFYSCPVPAFEQYVLAELINSGDFERHINRIRRAERKALNSCT